MNEYTRKLIVTTNVLYVIALFSTNWFTSPEISYGVWWVRYCDVLKCQLLPAFFTEEPTWYHVVQFLLFIGWMGQVFCLLLTLTRKLDAYVNRSKRTNLAALLCILSAFIISSATIVFYVRLTESYTDEFSDVPQMSWSSYLAGLVCILDLIIGLSFLDDRCH